MRSISIWGPVGRPDTRGDQGSDEGGRRGYDDGSHWPSRMGSRWPSLDRPEVRSPPRGVSGCASRTVASRVPAVITSVDELPAVIALAACRSP
jgi:hypothetical protein